MILKNVLKQKVLKQKIIALCLVLCFGISFSSSTYAFWWFFKSKEERLLEDGIKQQVDTFCKQDKNLNPKVVSLALTAYNNAKKFNIEIQKPILTIIDYSLMSNIKRLWVLDLDQQVILFNSLVAHGKYTGEAKALYFSDTFDSLQSSLGVFLTRSTYVGHEGYTLKIAGLEYGVNANAEARHIVIHGAWYASEQIAHMSGHIGRSWGCPAVEPKLAVPIIDTIKDGSIVFSYYPDKRWLKTSPFLR